ncbi:unnamed protein product [Urochloa decumbens]|uniref:Uncharacterized protein n=1 Tax=Urochloa decumbens TaxID=240449 RepID=A0ABC9C3K7_9POAL
MDVPFFVAFSGILLLGRYFPFALPANARAALADSDAAPPTRTAKCAISVAIAGLVLLVSMQQCSSGGQLQKQCPAEAAMEPRALCLNSAALFLGTLLLGAAYVVAARAAPPVVGVAVEHLTGVTETIAITALTFAHDLCIFLKASKV